MPSVRPAALLLVLAASLLTGLPARSEEDPWKALRTVREALATDAPLAAEFIQTYVPAGFTSGERENGRLFVALPDCLRWDYQEPYPRSYLLCGQTVWAWSPDEAVGDRFTDVSHEEAGLDFLLLSADRLAERYDVIVSTGPDDLTTLELAPRSAGTPFRTASIVLDIVKGRPVEIAYEDHEGNETRFTLASFARLDDEQVFTAPQGLDWFDG